MKIIKIILLTGFCAVLSAFPAMFILDPVTRVHIPSLIAGYGMAAMVGALWLHGLISILDDKL